MQIPIPRSIVRAWDKFIDTINVPIKQYRYYELRRLDIFIVIFFFVCIMWYYATSGWMGALQGGALYLSLVALSLWLF
jgi:glucose-6-phosphate-specific signal transduction histidine kinase